MNKATHAQVSELERYDTATITNVVATYPADIDNCLGLYNPWNVNWYTNESIKCIFPELGPRAGYAVTVQYGIPDPNYNRMSFDDVLRAIELAPKPVILVIKQNLPDEIKKKNGLSGGNMTTAIKALGCIGVISDGPSRDIQEIREMNVQYLLTGICPGHGDLAVEAINIPVHVCGMDVAPGEIIHMDENGACKFPSDKLPLVLENSRKLADLEAERMDRMRKCTTAQDLINILDGFESSGSSK